MAAIPKGRLTKVIPLPVPPGPPGPRGPQGLEGTSGLPGPSGRDGRDGVDGKAPDHKWEGTKLRFQRPDGTWGDAVELKGQPGLGAGGEGASQQKPSVNYTSVTTETYTVQKKRLIDGNNIFGVNYAGAVTITIPETLYFTKLITIKDESGSADSNNITIQME